MGRQPLDSPPCQTPSPERRTNSDRTPSSVSKLPIRRPSPLSGESHPPPPLTGTKRTRTGQPRTPVATRVSIDSSSGQSAQSYITPSPSEDEAEWKEYSSSASESDSDVENDSPREYTLPQHHNLQAHRPQLQQLSIKKFKRWSARIQYHAPPDDRIPPRKRCKTLSHWRSDSPRFEDGEDVSDEDLVVLSCPSRSKGYFHLDCPYHIYDPQKYQQCLLQDGLQSIEEVINHIKRHHMKPPFCPVCSETFDTVIQRDIHRLKDSCKLRDLQPIDGINGEQKSMLTRRDKYYLGERTRWRRIWTTVFPKSEPPPSPYLDEGCGLAISMARDFWNNFGHQCVSEFLEDRDLLDEDDERAHEALCKLAQEDLLDGIIKEHESN